MNPVNSSSTPGMNGASQDPASGGSQSEAAAFDKVIQAMATGAISTVLEDMMKMATEEDPQ